MNAIRTIYHIARADLLERVRQYSFLVVLGITMMAAYFFVPPADAGYITLYLDHYRGIYNSAWIGASVALSTTLLLALFGFYLVKNSIQRDVRTGVGQIIASTSVKKLHYLTGKSISNFLVLSIIVLAVIVIAFMMQLVRGEVVQIELWPLISPFLFLTLPTLSVVAVLAVLFETRPALQGGIGNIIYFIMFIFYSMSSNTSVITTEMVQSLAAIQPGFSGSYGIGFLVPEQPIKLFEWQGVTWTGTIIIQQLSFFLVAFLLILVAVLLFRGFQEAPYKRNNKINSTDNLNTAGEHPETHPNKSFDLESANVSFSQLSAANLPPAVIRESFLSLVVAEWRLMMKNTSLGWYVIAGVLAILCISMPVATSSQWMIWPITWIWPMLLWSGLGNRESRYNTHYLIASTPRYVTRQLSAVWVAGFILTCLTGIGMLIRLIMEGNMELVALWLSASIFIPSFALACGVLTGTNRTFEVLYMIIWYLGPFNKMPFLDFLGTQSSSGTSWISEIGLNSWLIMSIYILISIGLLILAYTTRGRLTQTS
ncbi:ABC transporter permease [Paenibacillus sp. SC116]|uniref:ABC transporter permease n=1 Tax=Paenibacillus sp. SC116 TaxID=2968986 RepID=UPI00215AB3DF|nr:ABC transporter permease [Paenibacillus sp. SC116]MCR8843446.1 ABC transporter permease [Paenibacillus sp. SC116]